MNIDQIKKLKSRDGFHDIDLQFADFIITLAEKDEPLLYLAAAISSHFLRHSHICIDLNRIAGKNFPVGGDGNIEAYDDVEAYCNTPLLNEWKKILTKYPKIVGIYDNIETYDHTSLRTPLILDSSNRLYLNRYWNYESKLALLIKNKCHTDLNRVKTLKTDSISSISTHYQISQPNTIDWQQVAVFAALVNNFTLITGGPGTGKTTVVSAILTLLLDNTPNLNIKLCAPTGKAAGRLKESIVEELANLNPKNPATKQKLEEMESYTIHRLLEPIRLTPHFHRNKDNPISADIIIIDEASMVSLTLFSKLMDAVPESARIILLGDKDQLASVEAGAVLANICEVSESNCFSSDFCNTFKSKQKNNDCSLPTALKKTCLTNSVVELKKSWRFDDTKGIGLLKDAINKGVWHYTPSEELYIQKTPDIHKIETKIKNYIESITLNVNGKSVKFRQYINAATVEESYQIFTEFRILCSHYIGKYGVKNINRIIHYLLFGSTRTAKGIPIMITENNNQLELYNGDIGLIWPDETGNCKAWFPKSNSDKLRSISLSSLPEHDEVFAMTIHKSQGSGFQKIFIILPDGDSPLLTKELIYTGITRAKKYCEIWANDDIMDKAISRKTERDSGLKDKLLNTLS